MVTSRNELRSVARVILRTKTAAPTCKGVRTQSALEQDTHQALVRAVHKAIVTTSKNKSCGGGDGESDGLEPTVVASLNTAQPQRDASPRPTHTDSRHQEQ